MLSLQWEQKVGSGDSPIPEFQTTGLSSTRLHRKPLTQPGQVLLLLLFAAICIDGVHDKGGLDTHCRPVATIHPLQFSGQEPIRHR